MVNTLKKHETNSLSGGRSSIKPRLLQSLRCRGRVKKPAKIMPGVKFVLLKTIAGSVYLNGEEEQAQEQIDKRAWSYEWMLYSDTQCFYHSDHDEWDLCKAFNSLANLSFIADKEEAEDIWMENREPSPPPPYLPASPPPPVPDIWQEHLPVQPSFMSCRDQFTPIEELLHLRYGFIDSSHYSLPQWVLCTFYWAKDCLALDGILWWPAQPQYLSAYNSQAQI